MNCRISRITLFIGLMLVSVAGFATDRVVPMVYPTIQAAINACVPGDRVLLQPQTFHERINLLGKNIQLKAFSDLGAVIDGSAAGTVITLSGTEPATTIIGGITIQNGKGANGGGINASFSLATIQNCIIQNNEATGTGGGVYGVSGTLQRCTIQNNKAVNGGGVAGCEGSLLSNTITGNTATSAGGGIYDCSHVIQSNTITSNEAGTNGGGAANCTTGTMYFNSISDNTAAIRGGGIFDSDLIIAGNLITGNQVTTVGSLALPGSFGGGIADSDGTIYANNISNNLSNGRGGGLDNCLGTLINNVVFNNAARTGGAIANCTGAIENNTIYSNSAVFTSGGLLNSGSPVNCIIWGNTPTTPQITGANPPFYCDIQGGSLSGTGNIALPPQVVDGTNGDMHLQANSPCIDAGEFLADVPIDYEGDTRGTTVSATVGGDGSGWDIGADEYIPPFVNLTDTWGTVTPKVKGTGDKLRFSVKGTLGVANVGNIAMTGSTTVSFYISNDTAFDSSDTTVGKTIVLKPLQPGATKSIKLKGKLPKGQAATGKYLLGVVDPINVISEKTESDNVAVSGPLP